MGDHNYLLYLHCYESRSTLMPPEEQEPQFDPLDRAMAISVKYNLLTTQYQRADVTETQVWPGEKIMRSFIVHTTGYLHAYWEVQGVCHLSTQGCRERPVWSEERGYYQYRVSFGERFWPEPTCISFLGGLSNFLTYILGSSADPYLCEASSIS